jgi:hypothetical protein
MSTEAKCQIDWRQDFYANARNILVMIDPQVPVYISPGVESWDSVRPLSEDLSEFSWDGTLKLPEVRRLLRGATRVAAQLAAKDEQLAERERELDYFLNDVYEFGCCQFDLCASDEDHKRTMGLIWQRVCILKEAVKHGCKLPAPQQGTQA